MPVQSVDIVTPQCVLMVFFLFWVFDVFLDIGKGLITLKTFALQILICHNPFRAFFGVLVF